MRSKIFLVSLIIVIVSNLLLSQSQEWTVYNKSNSGLPYDIVLSITIDKQGNIWVGTDKRLAAYGEEGYLKTK